MGFDLKPLNEEIEYGRYNNWSWFQLWEFLEETKTIVTLAKFNDGDKVSKEDCLKIAKTMEENKSLYLDVLNSTEERYDEQLEFWRTCQGCEQW